MERTTLTICDKCGLPEEASELQSVELNGNPARVCLRCVAEIWPYAQKVRRGKE